MVISELKVLTACLVAVALTAGLAGPTVAVEESAARKAPRVELRLGALERGAPPAVPFMTSDGRLVHGQTDLRVRGHATTLLGEYDGSYVYSRRTSRGSFKDVRRVTPDGTVSKVTSIRRSDQVALSDDGQWLAVVKSRREVSSLRMVSVATGVDVLQTTVDLGWPNLLDVDGEQVVLSSWNQRGTWSVPADGAGEATRLARRVGYHADIELNRLASFTRDPYRNGCSVISRLRRPGKALTRSCTERLEDLSPGAARFANVHILSDGIGPSKVVTRRASGKRASVYSAPQYFGQVLWEDDDTLLMHTYNKRRSALVRCTGADCEIAVPALGKSLVRAPAPGGARTPR